MSVEKSYCVTMRKLVAVIILYNYFPVFKANLSCVIKITMLYCVAVYVICMYHNNDIIIMIVSKMLSVSHNLMFSI